VKHGITPRTIFKSKKEIFEQTKVADSKKGVKKYYAGPDETSVAADPLVGYLDNAQLKKLIDQTRKKMEKAAKELDFIEAARLRDELEALKKMADKK
jgi:excinuclease ABC subunit B